MTVTLEEAKTDLGHLIERALHGEPIHIIRDGKLPVKIEVAELPARSERPLRRLGLMDGVYIVPADIKGPFREEIEEMFGLQD